MWPSRKPVCDVYAGMNNREMHELVVATLRAARLDEQATDFDTHFWDLTRTTHGKAFSRAAADLARRYVRLRRR